MRLTIMESQLFDFEAVNNEEFFQREFESPLAIDPSTDNNGVLDLPDGMGNDIADTSFNDPLADSVFIDGLPPGFANINLDLAGNAFEHGIVLLDFATPPGDFTLAGTSPFADNSFFFGTPDSKLTRQRLRELLKTKNPASVNWRDFLIATLAGSGVFQMTEPN